jgi:hypothetical protein
MKELDYGKGYLYAHYEEGKWLRWIACQTHSRGAVIISQRRKSGRNCWRNGWKRFD